VSTVRYVVTPVDPRAHYYAVRCTLAKADVTGQIFTLPSWIRGSYLVRDFAKHIVDLRACSGGKAVAIEKLDKRTFRCAPCEGELVLDYSVYAFDDSVRKAYLDVRRGFFNGSSLFWLPAGYEKSKYELTIHRADDPACEDWQLATTLKPAKVDAGGYGRYVASGYEDLIDHPVEMGLFERLDFDVDGVPHSMILAGRYELDGERLSKDLTRICHVQREMFGQEPGTKSGLPRFLFLTNVAGAGYGGLEHRASTALICSRNDLPRPGQPDFTKDYRGFLGLCSHEYFHLWNIKRISAASFLESDLGREAYTRDLWHYEGITSYYDDLMMLRAGVLDAAAYLDVVAECATRLSRAPGHLLHTLADASFEAWIKYYQPDENSSNVTVSYYVKGALVALCLDLHLRLHSKITLDDVMRALWQRYGREDIGVPEGGLEQVAAEISGLDLKPQFDAWLRATGDLPLAQLLESFGVKAERRVAVGDTDTGGRSSGKPVAVSLGLRLRAGETTVAFVTAGGPAQRAGISGGDQLVAIDDLKITAGNWARHVYGLQLGRSYTLVFFRGDELMRATVEADAPPADTWTLSLAAGDADTLARRKNWLGH
jgi:predicted metalloprotease with PDZ domain